MKISRIEVIHRNNFIALGWDFYISFSVASVLNCVSRSAFNVCKRIFFVVFFSGHILKCAKLRTFKILESHSECVHASARMKITFLLKRLCRIQHNDKINAAALGHSSSIFRYVFSPFIVQSIQCWLLTTKIHTELTFTSNKKSLSIYWC